MKRKMKIQKSPRLQAQVNGFRVARLRQAIHAESLDMPFLLSKVLDSESWRSFAEEELSLSNTVYTRNLYDETEFSEFVNAPAGRGLACTVPTLLALLTRPPIPSTPGLDGLIRPFITAIRARVEDLCGRSAAIPAQNVPAAMP
jgi:hypothetical protein